MILLDTSGLVAALSPDQDDHLQASRAFLTEASPFLLSPFVLAEVDYFLLRAGGVSAELRFLTEIGTRRYTLSTFDEDDVTAATEIVERYRDQTIGLADASIVVLAGRYGTNRVLTLDERHFRTLRTPAGEKFTILPADA